MKYPEKLRCLLFLPLILLNLKSSGQTATGIGFAYGPNRPFSNDYSWGKGFQLFSNLAITDKWEIIPNIGYELVNSNGGVIADRSYFNGHFEDIDLFYIGASAKYVFNPLFFIKAGPILYIGGGNEDIAAGGIGGTAAAGFNFDLDKHSAIELSLVTTVIDISSVGNGITPFAGIKAAYVFNFAHGKLRSPPNRPGGF